MRFLTVFSSILYMILALWNLAEGKTNPLIFWCFLSLFNIILFSTSEKNKQ